MIAKLRTGGESPAANVDENVVAGVVSAAVDRRVPLKFTAGLHHAVRHSETASRLERHGFLNLMVATRRALDGADHATVREVLASRDSRELVAEVSRWSEHAVSEVRTAFVSFGCCGVEDPVRDLVELGLVAGEPAGLPT